MIYITTDGKVFQGDTSQEIIEAMKNDSPFTRDLSLGKHMNEVARRASLYYGVQVDEIFWSNKTDAFLCLLEELGHMKKKPSV